MNVVEKNDSHFVNVTVSDVQHLAKLFDVDISIRRITLSGKVFVKTIMQRLDAVDFENNRNEIQDEYVNMLRTKFPQICIHEDNKVFLSKFREWISPLEDIDNLMQYVHLPTYTIVQFAKQPGFNNNIVLINKDYIVNAETAAYAKAFVAVEPVPRCFLYVKSISVENLHLLIEILPSYFMLEKHFVNVLRRHWNEYTINVNGLISEFIDANNNSVVDRPFTVDDAIIRTHNLLSLYRVTYATIPVTVALHRLNCVLQGFDMMDVDDVTLDKRISWLESKYGITMKYAVYNFKYDVLTRSDRHFLLENHTRGQIALVLLSLNQTSVKDIYNVYVTSDLRVVSLTDVLRSHACDGLFLLTTLANLTRTHIYIDSANKYTNAKVFSDALHVIMRGMYPYEISRRTEYMTVNKRILALRVAHMYIESKFLSYLKFGQILKDNDTLIFWHSLFKCTPILLKRTLLSIKNGNEGLNHVPLMLLCSALAELNIYNLPEKQLKIHISEAQVAFRDQSNMYLSKADATVFFLLKMFNQTLNMQLYNYNVQLICNRFARDS